MSVSAVAERSVPEQEPSRPSEPSDADWTAGSPPSPPLERGQLLFRTLGAAEIHVGPDLVVGPSSERMFALLSVVAMSPEHCVARARLLELVWPDLDEGSARHSLRQHTYRLRQRGIRIEGTRAGLQIDRVMLLPCFALDRNAALFERDVLRGQEPFGHLFAGWVPGHAEMREWVEVQRDQYHADVRRVLIPELRRLRDRAQWMECERWARTVLEFDAYNEDATLILAQALVMSGSRLSASTLLETYVRETGASGTELARRVEREHARILRAGRVSHEQTATRTLIGRDEVLSSLDGSIMRAMQGEAQVVQLRGPAGIGKTEVAYEVTRRAVLLGFARAVVRAARPVTQVPYGTLSRLTRDLLELSGSLGCKPANLRLLRQFAGVEPTTSLAEQLDTDDPADSLTECLLELIGAISEERPLFIFLDDLQYVDIKSKSLLQRVVDLLNHERLFMVCTESLNAVDDSVGLGGPTREQVVVLTPLSIQAATRLAAEVQTATGRQLDAEAAARVARSSDRTPLHVIALEREQLVNGFATLANGELHVALTRQVRRLSLEASVALRSISVVGGSLPVLELDQILDSGFLIRVAAVRELVESGLVDEREHGVLYTHEEVRRAATESWSESERLQTQRQVGIALERFLEDRFDVENAMIVLRMALACGDHSWFIGLCQKYASAIADAGSVAGMVRHLESAVAFSRTPTERQLLTSLLAKTATRASSWHVTRQSTASIRRTQSTVMENDPELLLAELEATLSSKPRWSVRADVAVVLELASDSRLTEELRLRALRLAIGASSNLLDEKFATESYAALSALDGGSPELQDMLLEPLMQYHAVFGDLDKALRLARECEMPTLGDQNLVVTVRRFCNASFVLRFGGELDIAACQLERAFSSAVLKDNPGRKAYAAWQLSLIAADRGQKKEAVKWAKRLDVLLESQPGRQRETWAVLHRHRIELLEHGDIKDPSELHRLIDSEDGNASRAVLYATGLALASAASRSDVQRSLEMLRRTRLYLRDYSRYGGQDILAYGALLALEARGQHESAIIVAERFVAERRERFSPHPVFTGLSVSLSTTILNAQSIRDEARSESADRKLP